MTSKIIIKSSHKIKQYLHYKTQGKVKVTNFLKETMKINNQNDNPRAYFNNKIT